MAQRKKYLLLMPKHLNSGKKLGVPACVIIPGSGDRQEGPGAHWPASLANGEFQVQ